VPYTPLGPADFAKKRSRANRNPRRDKPKPTSFVTLKDGSTFGGQWRRIRYRTVCRGVGTRYKNAGCGRQLPKGTRAFWVIGKGVFCFDCGMKHGAGAP
jgi:hypothetical protein